MDDIVFKPQGNNPAPQPMVPKPPEEPSLEPDSQPTPPMPPIGEKKSKGSKLWMILFVLMTLAAGALGWLYYQETQKEPEVIQTNDQQQEQQPQTVSYTAEVGKFKLELPAPYGIVKLWDGPGEGAAFTELQVGTVNAQAPSLVTMATPVPFSINAVYEAEEVTLENSSAVKKLEEDDEFTTRQDDVQFAGVTARVYKQSGLFDTMILVFMNENIEGVVYQISFAGDSLENDTYKAVAAGFSFVTTAEEES